MNKNDLEVVPLVDLPVLQISQFGWLIFADPALKKAGRAYVPDVAGAAAAVTQQMTALVRDAQRQIQIILDEAEAERDELFASIGYKVPVPYAAGIQVTSATTTVSYQGATYAPVADALPFTTGETFMPSQWRLIQGVSSADLGSASGSPLVGWRLAPQSLLRNVGQRLAEMPVSFKEFPSFEAAARYCSLNGRTLLIPDGNHFGTNVVLDVPVKIHADAGAYVDFSIDISGKRFVPTATVQLAGDWPAFPVGTTSLSGNFSAFSAGDIVAITLSDGDGGSQAYNEAGLDFATVQSASSTSLVIATPTRLAYRNPVVSKLEGARKHVGDVSRGSFQIPGNYLGVVAPGDVVRIENTEGTDGVQASPFYFELAKVRSVTSTTLTFEARLTHRHINPWVVKTVSLAGVSISGSGRFRQVMVRCASSLEIRDVSIDRLARTLVYDSVLSGIRSKGVGDPSTSNSTWMFGRNIATNLHLSGSRSSTDNAAFKFMSCSNMVISNVVIDNTQADAQGNYGFFGDAFYTPYRTFNTNVVIDNVVVEPPRGGSARGFWIYGIRGGSARGISGASVYQQGCVDFPMDVVIPDYPLEVQDVVRCEVIATCRYVAWRGGVASHLKARVRPSAGDNNNRAAWVYAGTTNPVTGESQASGDYNTYDVDNLAENFAGTTLYVQSQLRPTFGSGCRDSGVAASIVFGSGVGGMRMHPNFLGGTVPTQNGWVAPKVKGAFNHAGNYQDGLVVMSGNYLWVDATGKLRISGTKPTSDLQGVVVGDQAA